ncbi:MAG: hypothetical protein ACI4PF_02425 [Christensenellales bacterium]
MKEQINNNTKPSRKKTFWINFAIIATVIVTAVILGAITGRLILDNII